MTTHETWIQRTGPTLTAVAIAFAFAAGLLWLADAPPLEAFRLIIEGSFGSWDRTSATLLAWVPLVLASAGLVVTFAAGMWNIGVEGQIILGAIAATWVARVVPGPAHRQAAPTSSGTRPGCRPSRPLAPNGRSSRSSLR